MYLINFSYWLRQSTIYFHLDNDEVGIGSTRKMIEILGRDYYCFDFKPTDFKDENEELKHKMKEKNNEQVQR